MKKRLLALLALCMLVTLLFGTALAADNTYVPYDGASYALRYSEKSDGTLSITGYTGTAEGELVLPKSIDGKNVTEIGSYAFAGCTEFSGELNLPDSLEVIGYEAFSDCSGFTGSLVIPDSVTDLEPLAFDGCSGFSGDLVIGNGITEIGRRAFFNCSGFAGSLKIGDAITTIGGGAFYNCAGFTGELIIPNSVQNIEATTYSGSNPVDYGAFENCTGFTGNLIIPDNVVTIGAKAFYNCSGFDGTLKLGSSVETIGASAFGDCTGLNGNLVIPDSVKTISSYLNYIYQDQYYRSGASSSFGAFRNCTGFSGNLVIGDGLESIGPGAFYGCSGFIGNLIVPDGVTEIGDSAFSGCSGFTGNVEIPGSVTTIGSSAFSDCSSLNSVMIPDSVTSISTDSLFYRCSNLTSVRIPNSVTSIGSSAFAYCNNLANITIPNSVTNIGMYAFSDCNSLTSVTIPNSVTSISSYAFYPCSNLTSVIIPNSVTSIGTWAFHSCSSLTSVSIPVTTSIGSDAFSGCTSVSYVKLTGVGEMGSFSSKPWGSNTKTIDIESGVTNISNSAFSGCSSLTSVSIPDSVTSIGSSAFSGCSSLTSVSIPDSVTSIGSLAFSGCNSLTDIYYSGSEKSWALISGDGKPSDETVTIHYGSTGPDDIDSENMSPVYFLSGWDKSTRQVKFGDPDSISPNIYTVANNVNESDINSLLGKYVLVTMEQGDSVLEYTVTDIQPVESKIGIVVATGAHSLTIDGITYPVQEDYVLSSYDGREILYHVYDGIIMGFDELEEKTGTLKEWDSTTGKITIDDTTYPTNYMSDLSYLKNLDISSHPKIKYTVAGYGYQPIVRLSDAPYEPDISPDYNVPDREMTEEESGKAELWNLLADYNGAYQAFCEAYAQAVLEEAEAQGYDPTGGYTAQAEAMMEADTNKKFLTFVEPFDDSLKVYAYRALCQMIDDIGELNGVDFSSVSFSDEFALGSDIVNQVASQIKSYKETIAMGDVEVQIRCGFFFRSDNRLGEMKVRRVTGGPTYSVYLLPNESTAKEAVEQYISALRTLGNKAVKNAYTTVIKELTGLSLSSMNEKLMSDALKRLNNKFSKIVIKGFDVGEIVTVLENCYDHYNEFHKLVKLNYSPSMMDTTKSSLEKIINFDMLNPVDFETTAATKNAAKKLTEIETRLIDALEEYFYTGKISDETLGKIDKSPFKWLWSGKCPIEIEVYDDNNQIGYAGDDTWFTDDILIEKRGEEIRVYSKEPVSVHVIGTDYGMMSFTIEEYDDGHPKGRINYYNIPLQEDQVYTVSLANSSLNSVTDAIMMDEQGTVIPAFEYISAKMDAKVQVDAVVSSEAAGMIIGDGSYVKGDLVTLTAYSNDGYEFVGWFDGDNCISISNTYAFVAYEDVSLIGQYINETASEAKPTYTITVNASPVAGGTVTGGDDYEDGEVVTVTAMANSGYRFVGWKENGTTVNTNATYTFNATRDRTLTAEFEQINSGAPGGGGYTPTPSNPSYQITVPTTSNGTVTVTPTSAKSGTKVTITATPNSGYKVGSVTVKDSSGNTVAVTNLGNNQYSFTMPSGKVTVDVTFVPIQASWTNSFTDVSESDWFYDGVAYVAQNGLMQGVGGGKFNPSGTTTRGMIVTILYRLENEPTVSQPTFTDVAAGQYYTEAVAWAAANKIVDGYGNNTFGPNDVITREQMATILYRYADYKGYDVSGLADLSSYTDAETIHDWALTAIRWANKKGLITGRTTTLVPQGTATRAEAAVILARFCQDVAGLD